MNVGVTPEHHTPAPAFFLRPGILLILLRAGQAIGLDARQIRVHRCGRHLSGGTAMFPDQAAA